MNRDGTACNIMIDINIYKTDRTLCKTCYNKNKRRNNINTLPPKKINTSYKQPNIGNVNNNKGNNANVLTYENHRHVIIGQSKVSKTFYMPKVLEKIGNKRPIHIITR